MQSKAFLGIDVSKGCRFSFTGSKQKSTGGKFSVGG
jgi:hypothetical protein